MTDEQNDATSNPLSDEHLPVGGEVDTSDGDINPDISNDIDLGKSTSGVVGTDDSSVSDNLSRDGDANDTSDTSVLNVDTNGDVSDFNKSTRPPTTI